jgi:SAM-dependent methyltransferase
MNKNKAKKELQYFYQELKYAEKDFRNKNLYNLILSRTKGEKVLDVGSGVGHFLVKLTSSGYIAEGIEPDKKLIDISRKLYENTPKTHNLSVNEIHKVGKKFSSITMIDVLEHLKDDVFALEQVRKKLNSNGRLIISVPAYQFLYSERDREIGHYRRYGLKELEDKLQRAGFKIQEKRRWNFVGFFVYLLFEKLAKKSVGTGFRTNRKGSRINRALHKLTDLWMKNVENNASFGVGLSILVVATPNNDSDKIYN